MHDNHFFSTNYVYKAKILFNHNIEIKQVPKMGFAKHEILTDQQNQIALYAKVFEHKARRN